MITDPKYDINTTQATCHWTNININVADYWNIVRPSSKNNLFSRDRKIWKQKCEICWKFHFMIGGQFCPWLSTLQSRWRPSKVIIIIIIVISIRFCNMRSSKNLGCGFVLQNWSYLLSQVGDTRRGGRLNTAWSLHPRSPPSLSHCWPRSHPGGNIFAILTLTCQNCETSERKERC